MHGAIRGALATRFGGAAEEMRILYGGSVNGENAAELLGAGDVDGALVGGASLTAPKFAPIVAAAAAPGCSFGLTRSRFFSMFPARAPRTTIVVGNSVSVRV